MKKLTFTAFFSAVIITIIACKDEKTTVQNPYDTSPKKDTSTGNINNAEPWTIEGLHRDVFKPTCANSGCHDGTFEPDFRTAQSSYNTLVNQKPIKNDQGGTFNFRVVPGNSSASILPYRMTVDLGGNSGIMPLVVNPGNPYSANKDKHIANLKRWIDEGAKDLSGKASTAADFPPQIMGVWGRIGSNSAVRGGKYEPLRVAYGNTLEILFSLADDKKAQTALTNMKINWSTDPSVYIPSNEQNLSAVSGVNGLGLYGTSVNYAWKYNFQTTAYKKGDVLWFRITCNDGNGDFNLPNENSMFFLKKYFAVIIE